MAEKPPLLKEFIFYWVSIIYTPAQQAGKDFQMNPV